MSAAINNVPYNDSIVEDDGLKNIDQMLVLIEDGQGHYDDLEVGLHPQSLHDGLAAYLADPNRLPALKLSAKDQGMEHWAYVSAKQGGKIPLRVMRTISAEDRTYAQSPFPITSIPKPLRPAVTPAVTGHQLIELDWIASHPQLLAHLSDDKQMIADLEGGDFYTMPEWQGIARDSVKIGLNTIFNGGKEKGLQRSDKIERPPAFTDESSAKAFLDLANHLLATRWAAASAEKERIIEQSRRHGRSPTLGIALMREESSNLRMALTQLVKKSQEEGWDVRVILPMHDGVLVSAPADLSFVVADYAARCMAAYSTRDGAVTKPLDPYAGDPGKWVKTTIRPSWRGQVNATIGRDLKAEAIAEISKDPKGWSAGSLVAPAALYPDELLAAAKATKGEPARLARAALKAAKEADAWFKATHIKNLVKDDETMVDLQGDTSPSYANLKKILSKDKSFPTLSYNERRCETIIGDKVATDSLVRQVYMEGIEERYGLKMYSDLLLNKVVEDVAKMNTFDPVKEYFEKLEWDGTVRLEYAFIDYLGAEDNDLHKLFAQRFFMGACARALRPGCKLDTVLVLAGEQGLKKSTFLQAIAPCNSYVDTALDPNNKDLVLLAAQHFIVEWGEMQGASKRDLDSLKAYITRQKDDVRPPYGRRSEEHKRRNVLTATTNPTQVLSDPTGSRRFWPVACTKIDIEGFLAVKDQIWAEAKSLLELDFPYWLSKEESDMLEEHNQTFTKDTNAGWEIEILKLINHTVREVAVADVILADPKHSAEDVSRYSAAVSAALLGLKFKSMGRKTVGGVKKTMYRAPDHIKNEKEDVIEF